MHHRLVLAVCAALAALLGGAAPLAAQGGALVRGQALAAESGLPLADVAVRVEGTRRGGLTEADGRFRLLVPAGALTIVAQRVGLAPERRTVTVAAGDTLDLVLRMRTQATVLAPTVVSATQETQRRAEASATIDVMDGAELRASKPSHPAQVMNRMAGVHVAELSGEGHSTAIRQPISTKPLYQYLEDGIPTRSTGFFNHNALYEVNIPQAAGIEVLKGPGTALYGSDAIGGVVNVLTRAAPVAPSAELGVEGGAFGYGRLLATGGFSRGRNGVRADLNVTRSDNWKDQAPFRRQSATLRWDHARASGLTVRTVLTGSNIDQQDVPPLDPDQFASRRALNRAPIAFRGVRALRLSSAVDVDRGATLWNVTPYARTNALELLPSWQLSYDPQVWDTRNNSFGVLARVRRDFEPLRARVILGTDADYSPGSFTAQQVVTTATGADRVWSSYTRGEMHYDYDVTYRQLSPYLHAEASPTARLRLDVGLRYDAASYDYVNHLEPLATGPHRRPASTSVGYGHLSPKAGLTYDLGRGTSLFGSYRRGFRAPAQGQLFQQNAATNTVDLEPVTVDSYEAGVRGQIAGRLLYQISAYEMRLENDILTYRVSNVEQVATNAGATRHRGIEATIGAAVTADLRLDVAYSNADHRYVEWRPDASTNFGGRRIEAAPRELASVSATYSPALLRGGRVLVEWNRTGDYAQDPANTHFYGGYEVLNAQANVVLPRFGVELFARGVNLLDRDYAEVVNWTRFQGHQLTPGAPRALYVGAKYGWTR